MSIETGEEAQGTGLPSTRHCGCDPPDWWCGPTFVPSPRMTRRLTGCVRPRRAWVAGPPLTSSAQPARCCGHIANPGAHSLPKGLEPACARVDGGVASSASMTAPPGRSANPALARGGRRTVTPGSEVDRPLSEESESDHRLSEAGDVPRLARAPQLIEQRANRTGRILR